jgi:hypothetical protein
MAWPSNQIAIVGKSVLITRRHGERSNKSAAGASFEYAEAAHSSEADRTPDSFTGTSGDRLERAQLKNANVAASAGK